MPSPTGFSATADVDFGAFPTIHNDFPESVADILAASLNDSALEAELYALLTGTKWGGAIGSGATVTYSFPTSGSSAFWDTEFYSPGFETTYFSPLSVFSGAVAAVNTALASWSHVADINFVQVTETSGEVGDIRIAVTDMAAIDPEMASTYAYAWTPGQYAAGGDVWINVDQPTPSGADFSLGANGYNTILHELGHAIGLDHPFSIYAFDEYSAGNFGALDHLDTYQYTTMSYSDQPGQDDHGDSSFYPTTPMWLDIQALQYLYGANTTYNAGDNTYAFNEGQDYYQTIYDAGGNDTISYSSAADGALIDLRGDFFFSQLGNAISLSNGGSNANNVTIYVNGDDDRLIENAVGGSGADSIVGNDVANSLTGGSGNDTVIGGIGADTVVSNTGADSVDGGQDNDSIQGNIGADTVDGSLGADTVTGNMGTDLVLGGQGNDWLEGNLGSDTIAGGTGNDTLAGGNGIDLFRYDAASLNTSDFAANAQDAITGGAGDLISLLGLIDELEIGNVALNALGSNAAVGAAFAAGQTNVAYAGSFLMFDLDGNGSFAAGSDFQISLAGVSSVNYFAGDDFFHLA